MNINMFLATTTTTRRIFSNSFHTSRLLCANSSSTKGQPSNLSKVTEPSPVHDQSTSRSPGTPKVQPTFLDKYFLVWSGHYKNKDEIPDGLEKEVIEKARSRARIRINLFGILLAIVASYLMVQSGKRAAKRGESVENRNRAWHQSIQEASKK